VSGNDKVLVVGPSWVGDMVMAQALYRLLSERRRQREIHVLAPAWSMPVLARMPEVTRSIELPVSHGELGLGKRLALGRRLREERYAQAIVLPRSLKAALVPFFAAVPIRTGYLGEWRYGLLNDVRAFDAGRLDQTVKRFVALGVERSERALPPIPFPALRVDTANLTAKAEELGLRLDTPALALMPGAEYGEAKRWPLENYVRLARRATRAGLQVWVLGSRKEADIGAALARSAADPGIHDLCGKTDIADAIDLLGAAAVALTNDSGLMHVAAAVGAWVVAIYGSSSPRMTPPLTAKREILYRHLECSPCFERRCPLQHLECLRGITVDEAWQAVEDVLGRAGTQPFHRLGNGP
jgi:heptosyltransferase-2